MIMPIDRQIQQRMAAVGNSPDRAMQTFKQKGDVLDLMVLEQLVSKQRQLNMDSMKEKGIDPTTVFDQKMTEALGIVQGKNPDEGRSINEVSARTRDTLNQQQNIANAKAQQAGVTQPPRMGSAGGMVKMAGGGIVGFRQGGTVSQAEIDAYKMQNPNEPFDDNTIKFIISNMSSNQRNKLIEAGRALQPPTPYSGHPFHPIPEKKVETTTTTPSAVPPVDPKTDDPNAGLSAITMEDEDLTLPKGAGKTAMLDGGIGNIVEQDLQIKPEERAGERRGQVAESVGRAEGMEALGRQVKEKQALTDELYTPEQEARNRKRALVIGASGRGSTVGAGVAAAMMNTENRIRDQKMKNLDALQGLEQKGILFRQQTGEKMEASYDKALDTYYGAREASMDALQNAKAQDLANARTNAQIESNIAIQNNRTLNGELDRKAEMQLEEMRAAREDKRYSRAERYKRMTAIEKQLSENAAMKQQLYDQERLKYGELANLEDIESRTPTQEAKIRAIEAKIRIDVDARLNHKTIANGKMSIMDLESQLAQELENLRRQNMGGAASSSGAGWSAVRQTSP